MLGLNKVKTFILVLASSMLLSHTAFAASYTVVSGDTLYQLGNLFNTTAASIKQANGLKSDMIYPGQVLNISSAVYTVKSGDTLYLIAQKYGLTLYSLRKANNKWTDSIYPGQTLILPGISNASNNSTNTSGGKIQYSQSDLDLLARLITAEADSEPYNAKVGVGAVVVNRVRDSRFPSSISGVIYQKDDNYYQFTPVENGWINKPASQSAKNAAYDALQGSDPSNGAVFYFDDSATNKWLWSKPITAWIGRMVFVY